MTKKEISAYVKKYGMGILCAIPIMIALDIWLLPKIGNTWVIVLDCVIILLSFSVTLVISSLWRDHITKKRTEFLHKKEQEDRLKSLETEEETKEEQPKKIKQTQKKNYKTVKHKKHK